MIWDDTCQCDACQGIAPRHEFRVNGTLEMVYEGVRALEALPGAIEELFALYELDFDAEAAEIRIYENMAIEALVMDSYGETMLVWNGGDWEEKYGQT